MESWSVVVNLFRESLPNARLSLYVVHVATEFWNRRLRDQWGGLFDPAGWVSDETQTSIPEGGKGSLWNRAQAPQIRDEKTEAPGWEPLFWDHSHLHNLT